MHYHRLKAHLKKVSQQNKGFVVGAAARESITPKETYFYFDDKGEIYVDDEFRGIIPLTTSWEKYELAFNDLQDAFRLGMAVAHLQHTELNHCDPQQLGLLNAKMVPYYDN